MRGLPFGAVERASYHVDMETLGNGVVKWSGDGRMSKINNIEVESDVEYRTIEGVLNLGDMGRAAS